MKYADTTDIIDYGYGQCYPYQINGNLAVQAVFCKSVTCYSNPCVLAKIMVPEADSSNFDSLEIQTVLGERCRPSRSQCLRD